MKAYTHLVWDFNGTILNDVEASLQAANALLRNHGLEELKSVDAYREVFGFPVTDYYRRIGFDFDKLPFADLAVEWVADYKRFSANSTVFPGLPEWIGELRKKGIRQSILSATERGMLEEQTVALGIRELFDELWGMDNIRAESKLQLAARWRETHPDAVAIFIGDTEHDADAARALGADCILVAAGHRPRAALEACGVMEVWDEISKFSLSRLFSTGKT